MPNWRDILKSHAITFDRAGDAASGNVSYTTNGKPVAIIFLSHNTVSGVEASIGLCDSALNQYCQENLGGVTLPISNVAVSFNDAGAGTDLQRGVVSSMDSNGFTITWTKTGSPGAELLTIFALVLF